MEKRPPLWLNYKSITDLKLDEFLLLEFFIKRRKSFLNLNSIILLILFIGLIIYIRNTFIVKITIVKKIY